MATTKTERTRVLQSARRFIRAAQKCGIRLQAAYLYGSYALDTAHADSDIDIAITSKDLTGDWLDDFCFLTRIADNIDARIEVIPFLPQDSLNDNPLVSEIKTTGIPLIGNGKNGKRRVTAKPKSRRSKRA